MGKNNITSGYLIRTLPGVMVAVLLLYTVDGLAREISAAEREALRQGLEQQPNEQDADRTRKAPPRSPILVVPRTTPDEEKSERTPVRIRELPRKERPLYYKAQLPDLEVLSVYMQTSNGSGIRIRNNGRTASAPTGLRLTCSKKGKACFIASNKWKANYTQGGGWDTSARESDYFYRLTVPVPSIQPGETKSIRLIYHPDYPSINVGNYIEAATRCILEGLEDYYKDAEKSMGCTVMAQLDLEKKVAESNEGNNLKIWYNHLFNEKREIPPDYQKR